jgi:hypothetical protein
VIIDIPTRKVHNAMVRCAGSLDVKAAQTCVGLAACVRVRQVGRVPTCVCVWRACAGGRLWIGETTKSAQFSNKLSIFRSDAVRRYVPHASQRARREGSGREDSGREHLACVVCCHSCPAIAAGHHPCSTAPPPRNRLNRPTARSSYTAAPETQALRDLAKAVGSQANGYYANVFLKSGSSLGWHQDLHEVRPTPCTTSS